MLRCFLLFLCLQLVSACALVSARDPKRAELHLKIGTSLLARGQYPAALRELLTAEKYDPQNPVVQNNLGLAYLVRERHELALKHIKNALDLFPQYTDARNNLGRLLLDEGKVDQAIEELKKASSDLTYGEPEKPLSNLAYGYFLKKDFSNANKYFIEALKYKRKNCFALSMYGRTQLELGRFAPAATSLDEATRICEEKQKEESFYFSALSYYKNGQENQAEARLLECLETFPKGIYAQKAQNLLREIR